MKIKKNNNSIPIKGTNQTIHGRFREIVSFYGENIALDYQNKQLTYNELDYKSDQLACRLIKKLGEKRQQVAIFIETGFEQIISILGILKAGMTYVPLDINFPSERNIYMLEDAECSALISNNMNASQARAISNRQIIINIDETLSSQDIGELDIYNDPDARMMIIYTSGSTGEPKGVIHSHRNIIHLYKRLTTLINISAEDIFAFYYSICFSAHAMQIISALLSGAKLTLFDLKKESFSGFSKWLKEKKITVDLMIPSVLRQFMATLKKNEKIPSIRILFCGGETLYKSDIDKAWIHLKKSSLIYNIYASTEAYVCQVYKITSKTIINSNIVPIGYSLPDFDINVIDDEGKSRETNKIGEIQIKSEFITQGYWNKPELSKQDFKQDSDNPKERIFKSSDLGYKQSDGCIIHIGRSDSMVKLRGYRIDLGEIENVLMQHANVKEAAVIVKENQHGTKHIVAYVVPKNGKSLDISYLKISVLRMLPSYMIPGYFVTLDSLPKNEIGKTIRKDFPDPDWDRNIKGKEIVNPKNKLQEDLKEIFERTLEVSLISITDNIIELGADSLRLFVAFDEIEKKFGQKLNIDAIVENPTIEFISNLIKKE